MPIRRGLVGGALKKKMVEKIYQENRNGEVGGMEDGKKDEQHNIK